MDLPKTTSGHDAILVVIDRLSKMAHFLPTRTTITAPQTAKLFIDNIFRLHELPKSLIIDRDTRFTSTFWQSIFKSLGTHLKMSTSFHPKIDGQTERTNRTLITGIRSYINTLHSNWDSLLPTLEFVYNNSTQKSTRFSPFFLNYGFNPSTPVTTTPASSHVPAATDFLTTLQQSLDLAKQHLTKAQQQQSTQANKHRCSQQFSIGDKVLLSTQNLAKQGATTIHKFTTSLHRTISSLSRSSMMSLTGFSFHPPWASIHLSTYLSSNPTMIHQPPMPIELLHHLHLCNLRTHEEYFVEAIIDKRLRRNKLEYLVKWQHYPTHDNTWEPVANLTHCQEKLRHFEETFHQQKK